MSSIMWLFNYSKFTIAEIYGIVVKTAEYDGQKRFHLKQKIDYNNATEAEAADYKQLFEVGLKFLYAWENYEHIPQESMPIKLFKKPDRDCNNLPEPDKLFFRITNAYLVLHKKLYDVISQFNLGKTHFSEVHIYDIETEEKLSDTPYYFMNIAETFDCLNSEGSQGIIGSRYSPDSPRRYIFGAEDNDIKFKKDAKNIDVDVWHEEHLDSSLFFSDNLVQTLLKHGFTTKELGLIRCIVQ